ncbi:MAG: DUF3035 domain-containing protein [Sphingorhabdus sp.]|uniref:DUF3035 domain-containing protein n=1 Tax=Sphingorhabdus sp. TaxID=1902408 RepID=UPI00273EEFD4|nr:DUF3035 domain-containing protein [Sphingorhabdus sp.]MDP4757551.1 DUF3035 domain-containing protein [Sphingorhabdus sp.]MDP4927260.1 DUF3035 domain-containing protein [Sphingorhabdus sp.]
MNKKSLLLAAATLALPMLAGCASVGNMLGGNKTAAPIAGRAAPLVVPPDFALEPTAATMTRSTDASQEQTLEALFGGIASRSAAERSISTSSGTAEAGIRSSVGDPQTIMVNKGSITRDIIAAPEGDGQTAQAIIPN